MNNKGFMFVETIVTTTILLVALVTVYISFSSFLTNEKRRLYYDDISYVYKTMTLRDIMYDNVVYYNDGTNIYTNVEALKKYNEVKGKSYYIIAPGQRMFNPLNGDEAIRSDTFEKTMKELNFDKLIYIPNSKLITDNDIIEIQQRTDNLLIRNYLKRLSIPCENDSSCSDIYNGIIISITREHKDGSSIEDDYYSFTQCMQDGSKKTMECQEANYISWVYA